MFSLTWFKDAAERALKTAAQFVLVAVGGNVVDVWSLDWKMVLGAAGAGALSSVLTSVVSLPIGNSGTASLTTAVGPATPDTSVGRHSKPVI